MRTVFHSTAASIFTLLIAGRADAQYLSHIAAVDLGPPAMRYHHSLSATADGGFVVAWAKTTEVLRPFGVRAQRFAADGSPQSEIVFCVGEDYSVGPNVGVAGDGRMVLGCTASGARVHAFDSAFASLSDPKPIGGALSTLLRVSPLDATSHLASVAECEPTACFSRFIEMDAAGDELGSIRFPEGNGAGAEAWPLAPDRLLVIRKSPLGKTTAHVVSLQKDKLAEPWRLFRRRNETFSGHQIHFVRSVDGPSTAIAITGSRGVAMVFVIAPDGSLLSRFKIDTPAFYIDESSDPRQNFLWAIPYGGNVVIMWSGYNEDFTPGLHTQMYSAEGEPLWGDTLAFGQLLVGEPVPTSVAGRFLIPVVHKTQFSSVLHVMAFGQ